MFELTVLPPAEYPELCAPMPSALGVLPVVFVGVSRAAGLKLFVIELVFVVELEIGLDIELDVVPAPDDALGAVDICPTDGGIEDCCACAAEIVGATNSASAHVLIRIELN
jgi:hypothetical protein